jgi:hypothetical protein
MRFAALLIAGCVVTLSAYGAVTLKDDGAGALTVLDDGKPVLVYNYATVQPPDGVAERYARESYIHPLFGLDGETLTEDFPKDHYHHRGVFWSWPNCHVGNRKMNDWELVGIRPKFEEWLMKEESGHYVRVGVQNQWVFDEDPEPTVRERIYITVYPATGDSRAIDFTLQFQNISTKTVTFSGSPVDNKGYGGFTVRPDAAFKPFAFSGADGPVEEDVLRLDSPWASVDYAARENGGMSGFAIFQHPNNPGYPHDGWILRHYAFLGASWPCVDVHTLKPGEHFELRYRLLVYRGTAAEAGVALAADAYAKNP